MPSFPYKRIVIIGATGSGKSTLAELLANTLGCDFIELDSIYWEPAWQGVPLDEFRERVGKAIQAEKWVAAGNYHSVRDLIWPKADMIIWLDYSFPTTFWQLTRRTFTRWWHQEHLWGTNYENIWVHFKLWSDDSLFRWLFKTYWRRKREIPILLGLPENQHLELIRFEHPRETNKWLAKRTITNKELINGPS